MKIEDMGVKITAGSGSIYHEIVITPEDGIYVNGASWSRAEAVDVAHALSTAVEKYDAMTRTQEQPAPAAAFTVGQELTGDEDLPIGTVVRVGTVARDGMGDKWYCLAPGRYSMNFANPNPRWQLSEIIDNYGPVTIERLP